MITEGNKEHPVNLNTHLWGLIIKEVHWRSGSIGVLQVDLPEGVSLVWSTPVPLSTSVVSATTFHGRDVNAAISTVGLSAPVVRDLYEKTTPYKLILSVIFSDFDFGGATYDSYKAMWIASGDPWQEINDLRGNTKDVLSTNRISWPGTLSYPADWSEGANHYGEWPDHTPGYFPQPPNPFWGFGETKKYIHKSRQLIRIIWLLDFRKRVKLHDGSFDTRIGDYKIALDNINAEHDADLGGFSMEFSLKIYPLSTKFTNTGQELTADKMPSHVGAKSWPYDANGEMFKISKAGFV